MIKFYRTNLTDIKINKGNILRYNHAELMILYSWYDTENWYMTTASDLVVRQYHAGKMKQIDRQIKEYENKNHVKKEIVSIEFFNNGCYYEPFSKEKLPERSIVEQINLEEALNYFKSITADEINQIKTIFEEYHHIDKLEEYYDEPYYNKLYELDRLIYGDDVIPNLGGTAKIIRFPKQNTR